MIEKQLNWLLFSYFSCGMKTKNQQSKYEIEIIGYSKMIENGKQ
jgi:hypothetical protein